MFNFGGVCLSIWFSGFYYWRCFFPHHDILFCHPGWQVPQSVKLQGGSFIVCRGQTFQPSHAQPRRTLRCWQVRRYIPSLFSLAYAPWLGCDIGGAKELGVIYFPTNWGAKEPQNLPNHRVVDVPCFSFFTCVFSTMCIIELNWKMYKEYQIIYI